MYRYTPYIKKAFCSRMMHSKHGANVFIHTITQTAAMLTQCIQIMHAAAVAHASNRSSTQLLAMFSLNGPLDSS